MTINFKRETGIIFLILLLIILSASIFIALNYGKLKQPAPVSENQAALPEVLGAYTPLQPRGTCSPNTQACVGNPKLCMRENKNQVCN